MDTVGEEVPDELNEMMLQFAATEIGVGQRRNWEGYNWPVPNTMIQIPFGDGYTDYMSDPHMAMIAMTVYNELRVQGKIKDDTNMKRDVAKIVLQLCTQRNMIMASGGNKNVPFYFNFRIIVKLDSEMDLDTNFAYKTETYGRDELCCVAFPVLNKKGKPEMHVSHEIRTQNEGLYGVAIFNETKNRFEQHALKSITTRDRTDLFDLPDEPDEPDEMTDEPDEPRDQEDTDAGAAEQQKTQPRAAMLPLPFKGCKKRLPWFLNLNHTWYTEARRIESSGAKPKGAFSAGAARGGPSGGSAAGRAKQKAGQMLPEMDVDVPEVYVNTFETQKEAMSHYPSKEMPVTGWGLSGVATGSLTLDTTVICKGDPKAWLAAILDGTARLPLAVVLEAWNGQLTMIEAVFAEMILVTSGVGMQSIFDGSVCQNSNDPVHAACIDSQQEKAAKGLILQPAYAAYMSTLSMDELLQAAAAETVVESGPDDKGVESAQVSDAPGGNAVESAVASGTQTSEKPLIDQLAELSIAPKFHPQVEALMTFTPEYKLLENDQVELTNTNPLCITVCEHDGKDDDVGCRIEFDKIDISGMADKNPTIVYQVNAGQLIKVTLKNTISPGTLPTKLNMSDTVVFTPVYITKEGVEEQEEEVDCKAGEEYELPLPTQKDEGDGKDAWELRFNGGKQFKHGNTIKLVFQLERVKEPLSSVLQKMQDDFAQSAAAQNAAAQNAAALFWLRMLWSTKSVAADLRWCRPRLHCL